MLSPAQREYLVLAILIFIFVAALIPSLLASSALTRDGLRKQDITYLKRAMEDYYNVHLAYPLPRDACISSANPYLWTFVSVLPHDVRESSGHRYRYCVTLSHAAGATGYFLEAQFETDSPDQRAFDEDEQRKFHYRIMHENGMVLYRVCGGEEQQCKPNTNE